MITLRSAILTSFGVFALQAPLHAELHTFTNSSGNTIEAELVSHKDGKVTLKRTDGAEFEIKPEIFSTADQEFIAKWMTETPESIQYDFRIEGKSKELAENKKRATYIYLISATSRSQDTLNNLSFDYRVLYEYSDREKSFDLSEGTVVLEQALDFNKTFEITTKALSVSNRKSSSGKIIGCLLRIRDQHNQVIYNWGSDDLAMKGKTWENTELQKVKKGKNAAQGVIK